MLNFDSHAHEGDIPGTVDLRAAEGDDTAYGQVGSEPSLRTFGL